MQHVAFLTIEYFAIASSGWFMISVMDLYAIQGVGDYSSRGTTGGEHLC